MQTRNRLREFFEMELQERLGDEDAELVQLLHVAIYGLDALDHGETTAIFRPAKVKAKGAQPFTTARLKMLAVAYVDLLNDKGVLMKEAIRRIAEHYGTSEDVVQKWRKTHRLKKGPVPERLLRELRARSAELRRLGKHGSAESMLTVIKENGTRYKLAARPKKSLK